MAEFRRRTDPLDLTETPMVYEDNVILWYDAISSKIQKNRELKSIAQTFYQNQSSITVVPLQEDSESLLSRLSFKERYLPAIEKMSENRKREWLTIRVLVKELLGEEKEILYNSLGKPYLSDNSFYIGISHTKGYAALILNKENEVAIDIEKITTKVENVWKRFVNEEEEKALSQSNELIHLLLYWSAKESIYKWLGVENVDFKADLHISPFEPVIGEWSGFDAYETRTKEQNCLKIKYFVHEDYVLTCI
ncbi:MAG: 4'-phosphopantetheinyl transferase superfamily protein [Candidatus Azobacteroides sp.]|nr:4'-phosphopantetheinyl transferase superfamily protein [Candidatus Azobacteroides sp.]